MDRILSLLIAYAIALSPISGVSTAYAQNQLLQNQLEQLQNHPEAPIALIDYSEVTLPSGEKVKQETKVVVALNEDQLELALNWLKQNVDDAEAQGIPFQVVTASDDISANGESIIARTNEKLSPFAKLKHKVIRATDSFKSGLKSLLAPVVNKFGWFSHNHPSGFRYSIAATRMTINATVMSALFHSHYIDGVKIGETAFRIPGLNLEVPFGGPALLAGVLAGTLSFIMSSTVYPKGHPKEGEVVFYEWLTTPGKISTAVLTPLLKKFGKHSHEHLQNISGAVKWLVTEFIFLGVPVLTLLLSGFQMTPMQDFSVFGVNVPLVSGVQALLPFNPVIVATLMAFVASSFSGVVAQYNLDAYLGNYQKLIKETTNRHSPAESLGKLLFYTKMLLISVVSTSATVFTLGADKWVGYTAVGSLFALGLVMNLKVSHKLDKILETKAALKAKEDNLCVEALKKGA